MVDPELLEILACPETRSGVRLAAPPLVAAVNERIARGEQKNRGGERVSEPVDELLVREDGKVAYVVRDGVPVMLVEESIDLPG